MPVLIDRLKRIDSSVTENLGGWGARYFSADTTKPESSLDFDPELKNLLIQDEEEFSKLIKNNKIDPDDPEVQTFLSKVAARTDKELNEHPEWKNLAFVQLELNTEKGNTGKCASEFDCRANINNAYIFQIISTYQQKKNLAATNVDLVKDLAKFKKEITKSFDENYKSKYPEEQTHKTKEEGLKAKDTPEARRKIEENAKALAEREKQRLAEKQRLEEQRLLVEKQRLEEQQRQNLNPQVAQKTKEEKRSSNANIFSQLKQGTVERARSQFNTWRKKVEGATHTKERGSILKHGQMNLPNTAVEGETPKQADAKSSFTEARSPSRQRSEMEKKVEIGGARTQSKRDSVEEVKEEEKQQQEWRPARPR